MRRSKCRCKSLRFISRALYILAAISLAGCAGSESEMADSPSSMAGGAAAPGGPPSMTGGEGEAAKDMAPPMPAAPAAPGTGAVARQVSTAPVARKIIYTAEISLVVDNLSSAQQKLTALVSRHKGYIAGTNVGGASGSPREGTWKIRIPVDNYDAFMTGAVQLGEVQTVHSDSQDVSEEYYDVEARLANKRVEEKRLLSHLQKSTAKLQDILSVEKEISRVREEIERMQGRLRVLANQTSLTTITITIKEIKDYVPPAPPTFATQITRAFTGSLKGMLELGKSLTLAVVALLPWIVLGIVIAVPLWKLSRRGTRSNPSTPPDNRNE